ncbi:MAG: murein biosynthesis integral membrane protein MurJ [Tissierellia bacterium]|jgi:putative peptidoglycan lipid II flippase|nr:murein biosynthesis integral membrane protein MurJ [Tissierellia bacterium]
MIDNQNQNSTIKNTFIVSFGTITSKIFGFIREVLIANYFGVSFLVDAYLIALLIPSVLFAVVGEAINTTVIPLITEYKNKFGRKSAIELVNSICVAILFVTSIIIILSEIFIHQLIHLVAPGFTPAVLDLSVKMSQIMLPLMLFFALANLGSGVLQSEKRFLFPSFANVPSTLTIIVFLFIFGGNGEIIWLAVGTLVGFIAQWLFFIPDLRKTGFRFRFKFNLRHPGLRKMGILIIPVIIGKGAAEINLVVDRMLASGLNEGSIAALNYASRVNVLVVAIIAAALAKAIYPDLSKLAVNENIKNYIRSIKSSLLGLLLLMMPCAVGIIILREPLIRIIFERGSFNEAATGMTAFALLFYAIGLPSLALREILLRSFYSLQDTKTPMIIGVITVAINIILNIILIKYLAHGGLALATSIAITIGFALLIWSLHKKLGGIGVKAMIDSGLKILLASIIMGVIVYYIHYYLERFCLFNSPINDIFILLICSILGATVYFLMIKFFKIEEFDSVWAKITGRFVKH